jgi:two-component system response regulator
MSYEFLDILLLEDNDDDAEFFKCALKETGFAGQIQITRDGAEALSFIFGVGNKYDGVPAMRPRLVILDLKVPKVNGMEVLQHIKANPYLRSVPIVILSSSLNQQHLSAAYKLGANSYLAKPLDFDEFTGLIQTMVRYWLQYNQMTKSQLP